MLNGTLLVQTSDGRLFACRDTNDPDLAHVWHAIAVKRVTAGGDVPEETAARRGRQPGVSGRQFAPRTSRMILLRKVGSTVLGKFPGSV
jgi:hypothetical protein